MNDLDYDGDMNYFQDQLAAVGITVEELDMCNYAGCTARQLQGIVDSAIKRKKGAVANG